MKNCQEIGILSLWLNEYANSGQTEKTFNTVLHSDDKKIAMQLSLSNVNSDIDLYTKKELLE